MNPTLRAWSDRVSSAVDGLAPDLRTAYAPEAEPAYRWVAYDFNEDDGPLGFGETPVDALRDLARLNEERERT